MKKVYKKTIKIVLIVFASVIVGGALFFANVFFGNPISYVLADNCAEKYFEKTYPEMNLEISKPFYNFKNGQYVVDAESPTSIDTNFSIGISKLGKLQYDYYENSVLGKFNTWYRINDEYLERVKGVLDAESFPYSGYIMFGDINEWYEEKDYGPKYGVIREELVIDKVYDIMELGKTAGHLVIYIEDEDVTVERASEVLLDVKKILDDKGITFFAIDFNLIKPRIDDKPNPDDTQFVVSDFLYADIYEDGLIERLTQAEKELAAYYAKLDDIKEKEKFISNE